MELSETRAEAPDARAPQTLSARIYSRELFRLQAELVKLQDWVFARKLHVNSL